MSANIDIQEHEPRPKERGMIWKEVRSPSKFGLALPGPEEGLAKPASKRKFDDRKVGLVFCKLT